MARKSSLIKADQELVDVGITAIETERLGLEALAAAMQQDLGANFIATIREIIKLEGRVIVTGMGKSGHIGRKITATLASTGTPAYYVHPGEASHGDLGMICAKDAVLAFSWSGETPELADLIGHCKRRNILLVGITGARTSTLSERADIALVLPKVPEACPNGLAPTTSTTIQLAFGDALAITLLKKRGFSASDFQSYHPGGKLGALLRSVDEVMHRGNRLPLAVVGENMNAALTKQSSKGFGCVLVINSDGKLEGIITDGDIRRHMANDLLDRRVEEVMTVRPLTITPNILLPEALDRMEAQEVSVLPVVDAAHRPTGIIHILDLLHAGVVN